MHSLKCFPERAGVVYTPDSTNRPLESLLKTMISRIRCVPAFWNKTLLPHWPFLGKIEYMICMKTKVKNVNDCFHINRV